MKAGTLVVRADASVAMGTGHVMRCLALAQAWRRSGGDVVFAIADSTPAIAWRIDRENFPTKLLNCAAGSSKDAKALASVAAELHATWIAIDGYHFSTTYQRSMRESGFKLLWIDDTGQCRPYRADVILNQNVYAALDMYLERSEETNLLLGPQYVLLREEFLSWTNWHRDFTEPVRRVLVTLGGSDSQNITAKILNALAHAGLDLQIEVVVGGSNPHEGTVRQIARELPCNINISTDVANMAELMAGADLAISAAGVTCYELALLQVPMVLVTLAENQVVTARGFEDCDAAIYLGNIENSEPGRVIEAVRRLTLNVEHRRSLANKARSLLDGNGAARVCQVLLQNAELQPSQAEIARA